MVGLVLKKCDEDWVKKCLDFEVKGKCKRRPRKTWMDALEKNTDI